MGEGAHATVMTAPALRKSCTPRRVQHTTAAAGARARSAKTERLLHEWKEARARLSASIRPRRQIAEGMGTRAGQAGAKSAAAANGFEIVKACTPAQASRWPSLSARQRNARPAGARYRFWSGFTLRLRSARVPRGCISERFNPKTELMF